jgi:hypothetical protein
MAEREGFENWPYTNPFIFIRKPQIAFIYAAISDVNYI